jgi:hypothetical protein
MTKVPTGQVSRFSSVALATVAAYLATFVAWAPPARAATDAEQAEALIREGVKLRANDSAALALPLFEKAYQTSRSGRTAAQLGLCELELGYWVEADRYLTEALAASDHPWIAKNKGALKKSQETARANIGELTLVLSPANAEVLLNSKPVDRALLGAPIRLGKGLVDVEVRAPGYEAARETVILSGGKREQRTFTLAREAVASGGSTLVPTFTPGTGAGAETNAATTLTASPAPADARKSVRTAAWITGGVAAAALVFGTVEAIGAAGKSSDFNDHTSTAGGVTYHDCGTNNLSASCKALKDDYDQSLTLSIVGFVGAGVLAAASAVLFVYSAPERGERYGAVGALACVPDPIGRGVGCSLRF